MKNKNKLIYSIGGGALVATTSAAIALPLIVKHIAEKTTKGILERMIPLGGPENNLADRGPLNYVALGDSVTAGYNGFMASGEPGATMKGDYLSYADYIASDLHKAKKLADYRNFSKSGDKIPDTRKRIFRDPEALKAVSKADLITISLGANDLLALAEIIKLPYSTLVGNKAIGEKIVEVNNARDSLNEILSLNSGPREERKGEKPDEKGHREESTSGYASAADMKRLVGEAFDKLVKMLESGSLAGLIDMEQELLDKVFDIIELDFSTLLVELHTAAPQAKIVTLGYAFPFHLWPDTVLNGKLADNRHIGDKQVSVMDVYNEFMNTYKRVADRSNYVQFFNVNDLKEFTKESDVVTYNLKGEATDGSQDRKVVAEDHVNEWFRAMPNPLDIHPSTYGHQLIGNYLFEFIAKTDLNWDIEKYQTIQKNPNFDPNKSSLDEIYTYAGLDAHFDIKDETVKYFDKTKMITGAFDKISDPKVLKFLGHILGVMLTPQQFATIINDVMVDKVDMQSLMMKMNTKEPKLYRGLIALVLYLSNGGTPTIEGLEPQRDSLLPLIKMLGGLADVSSFTQQLDKVFAWRHSTLANEHNTDFVPFVKDIVEVGKEMGFDISANLPHGWDTTESIANSVLMKETSELAIVPEQSFLIQSLSKIGLAKPWDIATRNKLLTPEIANDEAHSYYFIKSFRSNEHHSPVMTLQVNDVSKTDPQLVKTEVIKSITTPTNNLFLDDFASTFAGQITINITDSTGKQIGTATIDLTGTTFAKDATGNAPAQAWIDAITAKVNAALTPVLSALH